MFQEHQRIFINSFRLATLTRNYFAVKIVNLASNLVFRRELHAHRVEIQFLNVIWCDFNDGIIIIITFMFPAHPWNDAVN